MLLHKLISSFILCAHNHSPATKYNHRASNLDSIAYLRNSNITAFCIFIEIHDISNNLVSTKKLTYFKEEKKGRKTRRLDGYYYLHVPDFDTRISNKKKGPSNSSAHPISASVISGLLCKTFLVIK